MKKAFSALLIGACLIGTSEARALAGDSHFVANGGRPAVGADVQGHLHCVFEGFENPSQMPDIFYCKSVDHGVHWTTPQAITKTPGLSLHPAIAIEKSGAIDIVWSDPSSEPSSPDIYFSRSIDDGKSWSKPLDISSTPGVSTDPAITIGAQNSIHIVWTDTTKSDKNKDIFYSTSGDGGLKWSGPIDISNTQGVSQDPTIATAADGTLHVAWVDTASGDKHADIFYSQCKNSSWARASDLSNSKGISQHPSMVSQAGNIFLTWSDNSVKENAADIWLAKLKPTGKPGNIFNLSHTTGISTEPKAALAGNDLAVVWTETSPGIKTPSIYGTASRDKGFNFSKCINLSHSHDLTKHPTLTISGGKMYVAWQETTSKNNAPVIKVTSLTLKDLATGPAQLINPKLHGVSGHTH